MHERRPARPMSRELKVLMVVLFIAIEISGNVIAHAVGLSAFWGSLFALVVIAVAFRAIARARRA